MWTRSTRGHRRAEPFNKAWASVGTRLSQQVAESGPWTGRCWPRGTTEEEETKGGMERGIVGGEARYRGHAKCKADTGITLWQGRGWHSRTLGP